MKERIFYLCKGRKGGRYFQIKVISLGVIPFPFNDKTTTMNTIELFLYLKFSISAYEKRVLSTQASRKC